MATRTLYSDSITLVANVENSWLIADGASFFEFNKRTEGLTSKKNAELRIAFAAGGTKNGRGYRSTYSDWWTPTEKLNLIGGNRVYLRCDVDLVVEVIYGVE